MEDENPEQEQEIYQQDLEKAEMEDNEDLQENLRDQQEDMFFGNQYPQPIEKESIFSLFKRIIGLKNSTKVSNLDKRELGMLDLSVRNCQYLAQLGTLMNDKSFNTFFMDKSEIILATAMSKKGWLPELIVSQKKYTQRTVQPTAQSAPKKGILGMGGGQPQQQ